MFREISCVRIFKSYSVLTALTVSRFVTDISFCHRFLDPIYGVVLQCIIYCIYTIYFNLEYYTVVSIVFYCMSQSTEYSTVLKTKRNFLKKFPQENS